MLRIIFFFALLALMFANCPTVSASDVDEWSYDFWISGNPTDWNCRVGVSPVSEDGFDDFDLQAFGRTLPVLTNVILVDSLLSDPLWPQDYMTADLRAPLMPGQSKTWTLELYVKQTSLTGPPPEYVMLCWSPSHPMVLPPGIIVTLQMTQSLPGYDGPTSWNLKDEPFGYTGGIPVSVGRQGFSNFDFTVTAVPEPSGFLAVLGSVAGMYFCKRRSIPT